jgi:hypothetical protein
MVNENPNKMVNTTQNVVDDVGGEDYDVRQKCHLLYRCDLLTVADYDVRRKCRLQYRCDLLAQP